MGLGTAKAAIDFIDYLQVVLGGTTASCRGVAAPTRRASIKPPAIPPPLSRSLRREDGFHLQIFDLPFARHSA